MTTIPMPRRVLDHNWLLRKGKKHGSRMIAGVVILSPEEAWELFDTRAREDLAMSGEEFEAAWKRGDLASRMEEPAVRRVAMLRTRRP